jgi:hypothetical protein
MNRYSILFLFAVLLIASCKKDKGLTTGNTPTTPAKVDPADKFVGSYNGSVTHYRRQQRGADFEFSDTISYPATFLVVKAGPDSITVRSDSNFVFQVPDWSHHTTRPDSLSLVYWQQYARSGTNEWLETKVSRDSLVIDKTFGAFSGSSGVVSTYIFKGIRT